MDQLDPTNSLVRTFRSVTAHAYQQPQMCTSSFAFVAPPDCGPRHFSLSCVYMQLVLHLSPKVDDTNVIDVMVLYSEEAYSTDGAVLEKKDLKDNIVAAFGNTQRAMDNSLIALDVNIVFLGKVSPRVK